MRRPRYKLQVSTFPFLAVLLCAMGSLLLFLFIMDRRAKIAAQHMNDEVLEARKKRTKDEEDKLQAEWEQAKAKLHQALLLQQGELDSKAKGLQLDLTEADGKLKLIQTHYLDLKDKVKDEAAKVAEIQLQIAGRRKGLLAAEKKETMSKKELIAAAAELAELEIAFQQLVSMKEREKQVHSLVPYHGKRGDARKPIYVECLGPGVVFHPNDRALVGYDFDAEAVREEVERRVGKLTVRKASDDKQPNKAKSDAYVLFLVRPNGITSYYRAQSALKGYRIDFGYELIDQDWELDFGGKSFAKNLPIAPLRKPNEISADSRPTFEPKSPFIAINQGGSNGSQGANGPPREKGIGFGSGTSGSGISSGPGPIAPPGGVGPILPGSTGPGPIALPSPGSNVGPGLASGSNVGAGSIGLPAPGSNVGPGLASGSNVGAGSIAPPAPGSSVGPGPIALPAPGSNTNLGSPGISQPNVPGIVPAPGGRPAFVPFNKIQPPVPIASAEGAGNLGNGNGPNLGDPSNVGGANPPGPGNPNQRPLPSVGSPLPKTNAIGANPAAAQSQGDPGGAPSGTGPSVMSTLGGADKPGKRPAPAPLGRMLGNKDFVIHIDCYDDHVNIFPGGMSFRWTAANMKSTDAAFASAVAKLIERRQASVRPGEPPYRPLICFRVDPDGRHCYLHVYPLLESLRVPMTRENMQDK